MFSRFKDLNIFQNESLISETFKYETISRFNNDIINFFAHQLIEKLKLALNEDLNKIPLGEQSPYFANNCDIFLIPYSDDIYFAQIFLQNVSEICRKKADHMRQDNQIFVSSVTAYRLLKYSNNWWTFKKEVFIFLIEVYLKEQEVEQADWEVFASIIGDICIDLLINHSIMITNYRENDETILFVNNLPEFPVLQFFKTNQSAF